MTTSIPIHIYRKGLSFRFGEYNTSAQKNQVFFAFCITFLLFCFSLYPFADETYAFSDETRFFREIGIFEHKRTVSAGLRLKIRRYLSVCQPISLMQPMNMGSMDPVSTIAYTNGLSSMTVCFSCVPTDVAFSTMTAVTAAARVPEGSTSI